MEDKYYLKKNVMFEPLVDGWYAWAHLVSPATYAMNVVNRHVRIMNSYVESSELHAELAKDPKMKGGPFVDYGVDRVSEVRELLEKTKDERKELFDFVESVRELEALLHESCDGFGMEELYKEVPNNLKGLVELVYDLYNRPSFRFIEPLLYSSELYSENSQSVVLSLIEHDERPFILSTPRLVDERCLEIREPFKSTKLDELFKMKFEPSSLAEIGEKLGIKVCDLEKFENFFTTESPKKYDKYTGDGVRWRYFGHACILIETKGLCILTDPILSYTYESDISRYTYEDLPDHIDYVLISHNHQDHILFETILQLRHKIGKIVVPPAGSGALQNPSVKLMFEMIGFDNVCELSEMCSLNIDGGRITAIPFMGEHSDLDISTKMCHAVEVHGKKILIMADSCNVEPLVYEKVHELLGDFDVVFLGMECHGAPLSWVYGPLLPKTLERKKDRSRRLSGSNYSQGIEVVKTFNCKEAYIYAMGQEEWMHHVLNLSYNEDSIPIVESDKFVSHCMADGVKSGRLLNVRESVMEDIKDPIEESLQMIKRCRDMGVCAELLEGEKEILFL